MRTGHEWALIRWRYVWGPGPDDSVRGVNVMQVIDGKIVEAAGYSKTAAGRRRPEELTADDHRQR